MATNSRAWSRRAVTVWRPCPPSVRTRATQVDNYFRGDRGRGVSPPAEGRRDADGARISRLVGPRRGCTAVDGTEGVDGSISQADQVELMAEVGTVTKPGAVQLPDSSPPAQRR